MKITSKLLLLCEISQFFSIFDFFYISQGSVATYVRCGGKHEKCFIENFLLNPMVTE